MWCCWISLGDNLASTRAARSEYRLRYSGPFNRQPAPYPSLAVWAGNGRVADDTGINENLN